MHDRHRGATGVTAPEATMLLAWSPAGVDRWSGSRCLVPEREDARSPPVPGIGDRAALTAHPHHAHRRRVGIASLPCDPAPVTTPPVSPHHRVGARLLTKG